MKNRRLFPLVLAFLLLGTCLALPALAAERADPAPAAAPSSCAAAAFSLPSFLAPAPTLRDTDPAATCGCGDSPCVGKAVGDRCLKQEMGIRVCRVIPGVCPVTGSKCECFLAP